MNKNKTAYLIIIVWVFFHLFHNVRWLSLSTDYPPREPEAVKYSHAITWDELLKRPHSMIRGFRYKHIDPLYYMTAAAVTHITGIRSYRMHIMLNMTYVALLFFFLYLLCREIESVECGIIAVCLAALYPGIYGFSRSFYPDAGVPWLIAATLWSLIKSGNFSNRPYSLLLGMFLGIGMLARSTFLLFVLGPLAVITYRALRQRPPGGTTTIMKSPAVNIALVAILCSLVMGIRYFHWKVLHHLTLQFVSMSDGVQPFKYLLLAADGGTGWIFFALFLLAFLSLAAGRRGRPVNDVLLAWFLLPLLALSLMLHRKDLRHTVPLLPSMAVISAVFLSRSRGEIRYVLPVFLIAGIVQFYDISFGKIKTIVNNTRAYAHGNHPLDYAAVDAFVRRNTPPSRAAGKTTVLFLVNDKSWSAYFNVPTWRSIDWLNELSFEPLIIGYVPTTDFDKLPANMKLSDAIIFIGEDDLKKEASFDKAFDDMAARFLDFQSWHNLEETDERMVAALEALKADVRTAFSGFTLLNTSDTRSLTGRRIDRRNVYVYVRRR